VNDTVLLRRGQGNLISWRAGVLRHQAICLHEDIGDTSRFEQHAPVGDDNQKCMHGVKGTFCTK